MYYNAGKSIHWSEIGRELDRRDDACRRHWMSKATPDQLIQLKSLFLMSREGRKRKNVQRNSSTRARQHVIYILMILFIIHKSSTLFPIGTVI